MDSGDMGDPDRTGHTDHGTTDHTGQTDQATTLLGRHGQRPCVATVTLSRDPSDSSKRGVRLEN